jgi:formylmethanofuran:tetrahydromethanopterin formyltransferase
VLYNDGEKTPEGQVGVIMEFIEAKGKALESRQEK